MEEDLAILNLLECPLCFQRLDVTAKVLPCQHTFCGPCLRKLASSSLKLRCPECRALVLENVEQLPANLLLVRLLEGLQQGSRGTVRGATGRCGPHLARDLSVKRSREARYSTLRQTQGHKSTLDGVSWSRALHNYHRNLAGELNSKSGDVVILRRKPDENWHHGEANSGGILGPTSLAQVTDRPPRPLPLCRALCDFNPKEKDQEDSKDFLTFLKGDIISILRQVDENWFEGRLRDKVGIFPIQFTELNSTATKLLGKRKGSISQRRRMAGGSSSSTADLSMCRFGPAVTLSRPNRPAQGPTGEIRAPSIGSPTFLGSSNPSVVAQLSDRRSDGFGAAPFQAPSLTPGDRKVAHEHMPTFSMALVSPQSLSASPESNQSSTQQLSISVCAALYSYTPCRPEELELRKGEMVGIYGRFKEGWLRGLSLRSGKVGILPASYITPVLRTAARFLEPQSIPATLGPRASRSPLVCRPEVVAMAQDTVTASSAVRSARGTALTTPAVSLGSTGSRIAHQGSQRRTLGPSHRGSSLQKNFSFWVPPSVIRQPQQVALLQNLPHTESLTSGLVTSKVRGSLHASLSRLPNWAHETAAPSADGSLSSEPRDTAGRGALEKQASPHPTSILVKPDSHKNSAEKPTKSVRFLSQETSSKTLLPTAEPRVLVPEAWGSLPVHSAAESTVAQRKVTSLNLSTPDSLQTSLKTALSTTYRSRVPTPYAAQGDASPTSPQRLRQDGRLPPTQENNEKMGQFQSNGLGVLEKVA